MLGKPVPAWFPAGSPFFRPAFQGRVAILLLVSCSPVVLVVPLRFSIGSVRHRRPAVLGYPLADSYLDAEMAQEVRFDMFCGLPAMVAGWSAVRFLQLVPLLGAQERFGQPKQLGLGE